MVLGVIVIFVFSMFSFSLKQDLLKGLLSIDVFRIYFLSSLHVFDMAVTFLCFLGICH